MGYTHYYRQRRSMTQEEFDGFKTDVTKLAVVLAQIGTVGVFHERYGGGSGEYESRPELPMAIEPQGAGCEAEIAGEKSVGFNGTGFEDSDHETFWVPRDIGFQACDWEAEDVAKGERFHCTKTAHKPYDAVVVACLLALKARAPGAWAVSSDGGVDEWAAGYRFALDALGRRALPLSSVRGFAQDKEGLARAREPSAWIVAVEELKRIAKATGKAPERSRVKML